MVSLLCHDAAAAGVMGNTLELQALSRFPGFTSTLR